MDVPFITTGELSPVQIVGAYAVVVGVWVAMAALLGHSARVFTGAPGVHPGNDAALSIMGGVCMLALLRYLDFSIAEFILEHHPRADADLVWFAELAICAFVGACGLRVLFGLR